MLGSPRTIPSRSSSKNSDNPKKSPREHVEEIAAFAVNAGRELRTMERQTRLKSYEIFAQLVRDGEVLMEHPEKWQYFIAMPFWSGVYGGRPKLEDRRKATHYLMRMRFGPSEADSKAASDWSLAAEALARDGIMPDAIVAELKVRRGITGVLKTTRNVEKTGHVDTGGKSKMKSVTTGALATPTIAPAAKRTVKANGTSNTAVAYLDCVPELEGATDSGTEVAIYAMGILKKIRGRTVINVTWMTAYG